MAKKKAPTDKELAEYLKNKSCMVVDGNSVSRTSILNFLTTIGLTRDKIHMIDNVKQAMDVMEVNKVEVVITEYMVGKQSGMELLEKHLQIHPNRVEASFFVLSQSNSMAIAAQMAELEVDGLIVKPFTMNALKETLVIGFTEKINPTQYISQLENAKKLIRQKNTDEALKLINDCKAKTDEPSVAFFFEGTVWEEMQKLVEAKEAYTTALKTNDQHYRSMHHLFQIYINEKNFDDAHKIGKKLLKLFPMSPTQIPNLTRMMIATEKFGEIFDIAEKFAKEENIDPLMVNYIAAALAVTAKHYQKVGKVNDSLKIMNRAAQLANGSAKILRNMSQTCLIMGKAQEAEALLKLVSEAEQGSEQYAIMDFEIAAATLPAGEIVKRGTDLLKKGFKDPALFSLLIKNCVEDKRSESMIDDLKKQAKSLYPSLADQF
jgi:tetratricopeptide (TPR) repeat protein